MSVDAINSRLDAVEDLRQNENLVEYWRKSARSFSDLERMCSRLYSYSIKQNTKIVQFQDISTIRLRELKKFFGELKKAEVLLKYFNRLSCNFSS